MDLQENINKIKQVMGINEEPFNPLVNPLDNGVVVYGNRIEPSESVELTEVKTDKDWLNEFKAKFPNWDYSEAEFYKVDKFLNIKNVKKF